MRFKKQYQNAIYFDIRYRVSFKLQPDGKLNGSCDCMSATLRGKCRHLKEAQEQPAYKDFVKELDERVK